MKWQLEPLITRLRLSALFLCPAKAWAILWNTEVFLVLLLSCMLTHLHAQTSSIAGAGYRLLSTACAIRAAALACKEMFSQMTEKEQFEHMKDFDYASLIFH